MVLRKLVALNLALALMSGGVAGNEVVEEKHSLENALHKVVVAKQKLKVELDELTNKPHEKIEIELIEKSDEGQYWYDHSAEFEPRIFVENNFAEHWGVDDYDIGETVIGVFDGEGWELLGFDK